MAIVTKISETISGDVYDVYTIQSVYPQITIQSLYTFINERTSLYYSQGICYSLNGGSTYSSWVDLTRSNVDSIPATKDIDIIVKYRVRQTTIPSNPDEVNRYGKQSPLIYPYFEDSPFYQFFELNDVNVLNWSLNVLEKLYGKGILPWYIQRNEGYSVFDDKDFIAFWHSICHLFALITTYGRELESIRNNDELIKRFLDNIGIYFNVNESSENLQYLFDYYLDEFSKRGTEEIYRGKIDRVDEGWFFALPYAASYPAGTSFSLVTSEGTFDNTLIVETTRGDLLTWLNTTIGAWTLDNSTSSNIYTCTVEGIIITSLGFEVPVDVVNGYLYNSYALSNASPIYASGWSPGSITQWNTFFAYIGGLGAAGGRMKEIGFTYWDSPNVAAQNLYGFNLGGSGIRTNAGQFIFLKSRTDVWINSTYTGGRDLVRVGYDSAAAGYGGNTLTFGHAVRLVKDSTTLTHGQMGKYTGNDGKVYRTICIGTQEWLADNLCETKYRDGSDIPNVTGNTAWGVLSSGAYCAYNNDESNALIE